MNIAGTIPLEQKAAYLRTLPAIRERCARVHALATQGNLAFFDYHPDKEADVAAFCIQIINRDYGTDFTSIEPHGRWRHLDAGVARVRPLIAKWHAAHDPLDAREELRRTIDLFLVSVLLDAGAGNQWSYHEASSGQTFARSEGLGVASVHMFDEGFFSGDPVRQPYRVDAAGLEKVTVQRVGEAMQVTEANPMVGLEGRTALLTRLSAALRASPQFFGADGRPGNIIGACPFLRRSPPLQAHTYINGNFASTNYADFLEGESTLVGTQRVVPVAALWHALIEGLTPIWPSRHTLAGVPLGDVWPCTVLKSHSHAQDGQQEGDDLVPFHKLTGWISYSIVEVLQKVAGWRVEGLEDLTGLPEYRNGGLLVDLGVLTLKPGLLPTDPVSGLPSVPPSHPAIVEWRAMTVIELDRIADAIRKELGLTAEQLTLAQVLEGATWKGGREIAKLKRPETGGPPIEIVSDGTVF
ncbi:hypothetical protein H0H81_004572 [Sphagnurus paluster]|uniref:Uracil catabolism protein 4 n=1 Tax=Sphagnurus paluster TaxID=117069 RepID=A0A9P7GQ41_9AGAR|nr:hypothetical protein H0H81_004572 [Sphagnurus paluster]